MTATGIRGSEALVSLFESHPIHSEQIYSASSGYPGHGPRPGTNPRARKPRALTMPSAPSTTFTDKTYRGRFPCGRYHRARIIQTTLRESLPTPPSTPPSPEYPPSRSRFDGLRRIFSSKRPKEQEKAPLKPLVLPNRLGLSRSKSTGAQPDSRANPVRRLSLSNWLPGPAKPKPESVSLPAQSQQLKPLVLAKRNSQAIMLPQPAENANVLAWLLECIQRDIKPQWSQPLQVEQDMLLQNGQARCLVVRAKRRSALF